MAPFNPCATAAFRGAFAKGARLAYAEVMPNSPGFDALWDLVGRRSDDPVVLAFHDQFGLDAPPSVLTRNVQQTKVEAINAKIGYGGELRRIDTWPPRRERGRFVTYVTSVEIKPGVIEELAHGLTLSLPLVEARSRAVSRYETPMFELLTLHRDDRRELIFVFKAKQGSLHELRLKPLQLPEDSPELARLAAAAPPPAKRAIPARSGVEPFPTALSALGALGMLDDVGFEACEEWSTGGPQAWTKNPDAEREFAVFGYDGSGGMVAFWLVNPGPITEQPVVLLGSEGEVGAVASDLADFLYLLAGGVGPYEAVAYGTFKSENAFPEVAKLAEGLAPRPDRTPEQVLAAANERYADIETRANELRRPG
jgi:hypothetical protein